MAASYEALEAAFGTVIERNRKGLTDTPCEREALSKHAFFYIDDGEPDDISILPAGLPFANFWVVTEYKGLAICAYVEPMGTERPLSNMPRPDYIWYPCAIPGERIRTNEREIDEKAAFVVDRALRAMQKNHIEEVDSPVQAGINRGRAKTVGKPSFIAELPAFIRVARDLKPAAEQQGGTHASPEPHDRAGHWRTYKASGKRVWINDTKVLGGSAEPRKYRLEAA